MDPLTSLDDRVSSLVLLFQGGSSSYLTTAINLATQLAVLEIAFFGIMLMLGRGAVFADSFMKIFKLGLIFWFVTKFPYFQDQIFDGFVLSANIVSGAPVDTSALLVSQYFDNGTLVWASIMECIKPLSFLSNFVIIIFFLLAGLVAYVGLILMGITAVLTILEYYIVTTIGFIILPFAAFSPTNFISNKIFSSFIAIGIKAATIIIISGFVISDLSALSQSDVCAVDSDVSGQMKGAALIFATAVLYLLVFIRVPSLAAGVLTGSPALGAGTALAMAGGAVVATVAAASSGMRAAGAAVQAGKGPAAGPSATSGSSSTTNKSGGTAKNSESGGSVSTSSVIEKFRLARSAQQTQKTIDNDN